MQKVITFHYTLKTDEGQILDSTKKESPLIFLTDARQLLPALEEEVKKIQKGEEKQFTITHEQAYGPYNEELVLTVHIKELPYPDVNIGDVYEIDREGLRMPVQVTKIDDDQVTLDGNPPKHSDNLNFTVEVIESRDATQEEIDHGHVHNKEGGCHHH